MRALLAAVFATFLLSGATLASDTIDVGREGGGPFRDECRAGDLVVGIITSSGKDLDQVQAICAPVGGGTTYRLAERGRFAGPFTTDGNLICPGASVLASVKVSTSRYGNVHAITATCIDIVSGATFPGSTSEGMGGMAFNAQTVACPAGMAASGLKGRHGTLIDAFGLVCSPFAKVQPEPQEKRKVKVTVRNGKKEAAPVDNSDNGGGGGGNGTIRGRANTDTTIYDRPQGKDSDYLDRGDRVTIIQCDQQVRNWCEVSAPSYGWVWGEELDR